MQKCLAYLEGSHTPISNSSFVQCPLRTLYSEQRTSVRLVLDKRCGFIKWRQRTMKGEVEMVVSVQSISRKRPHEVKILDTDSP